jgi:hypothetical protein
LRDNANIYFTGWFDDCKSYAHVCILLVLLVLLVSQLLLLLFCLSLRLSPPPPPSSSSSSALAATAAGVDELRKRDKRKRADAFSRAAFVARGGRLRE